MSRAGQDPILKQSDKLYQCRDLSMLRGMDDRQLTEMYLLLERDKILPIIYHECHLSLYTFLTEYLKPERTTMACYKGNTLCGFMWVSKVCKMGDRHSRADCGMAFVRNVNVHDTLTFAHMCIEFVFDTLRVDAIHGIIPEKNRAAVAFGKRCGFNMSGPIEGATIWQGQLCGAMIMSMTKDTWKGIRPW